MGELVGALLIGLAGGAAGGLLGIGGGTVFVPGLVLLLGIEQHTAQGISLVVIVPTSISATIANLHSGQISGRTVALVAPLAVVFAAAGAVLAGELEGDTLTRLFGVIVLYVGVRTLLGDWWTRRSRTASERSTSARGG